MTTSATVTNAADGILESTRQWLDVDLDDWTRRIVRRHFDPATGSPYWLARRPELSFDPRDITRYEQLEAFEAFPLPVLRDIDPTSLVPLAVPRPLAGRVFESGGTTGRPCRVFYTAEMARHHTAWRLRGLHTSGFQPGRAWLYACPSGPHIVGRGANQIAELFDSTVYTIDLDPRFIKEMIRNSRLPVINMYVDHVVDQIIDVLDSRQIDYLETTPALLQTLVPRRPDLVARLSGVGLGGTQFTSAMYRHFASALGDAVISTTYGNTFGCAMGLPAEHNGDVLPYVPGYPQVTLSVLSRDDGPVRAVGVGELGRVRLTVLHEDLFLPNVLERDQALRYGTGGSWPCDGVANVRPLQASAATPEGLY